jgi:sugar lactone lactonase YvrE
MKEPERSIHQGYYPQSYFYPQLTNNPFFHTQYFYPQYSYYQQNYQQFSQKHRDQVKGGKGRYEILFHWNRLNWNFKDSNLKKPFEANQYWKKAMPGNIKIDKQGNYYVSVPRWAKGIPATLNRIVEVDGKPLLEPFPSWDWNKVGNVKVLQSVLGYEIDELNRMWILDQGKIAYAPSLDGSQKLVLIDLNTNMMIDSVKIPDEIANYRTSFLNDLVVDNKNGFVYITDSGNGWPDHPVVGGIIVYNMKTKTFRRVLDRHFSSQDFPGFIFEIDNKPVFKNKPIKIGSDGIALSADRITLYYTPITGRNLYSIDTSLLRDYNHSLEEIERAVQTIGSKGTTTDGMHADNKGNVFYTMLEGKGVGIYNPYRNNFKKFVSDDRMLWVDGVAFDQKGSIIFNNNRLHQMFGNEEDIDWDYPYNLIIWKAFVGEDIKSYLYAE